MNISIKTNNGLLRKDLRLMTRLFLAVTLFLVSSCSEHDKNSSEKVPNINVNTEKIDSPSLIVLGNVQDAGSPHMGCKKDCCKDLFENPDKNRMVVSLGLVDPLNKGCWMIEASPDFPRQAKMLKSYCPFNDKETPDGIFLTHAHIGHYIGLMYLGKEAMNADQVPIYAMTRMKGFLIQNGPWSQLFKINNIRINNIDDQETVELSSNLNITPFLVPHRDEYSETVGYHIQGPNKSALFIPDIDKWSKWNLSIVDEIKNVDYAFIDATFYDAEEINNRDISEIPHPFVIESMELFSEFSNVDKAKIYFIHLNHTNPLLNRDSPQAKLVMKNGFKIAQPKQIFKL